MIHEILGDFLDGLMRFIVLLVISTFILTASITYYITKQSYSKESVEKREQREATIQELTPKQRKILGYE